MGEKYRSLFYQVNVFGLLAVIVAVMATLYIHYSLLQDKIFSARIYKRFICASLVVVIILIFMVVHFLFIFLRLT